MHSFLTSCCNLLLQNVLNITSWTVSQEDIHTPTVGLVLTHASYRPDITRCRNSFIWFICLLVEGFCCHPYSSLVSRQPPFDLCIWVILNLAEVPIFSCCHSVWRYFLCLHQIIMGELLQPAAWQTLITARLSLD